jgi:pyruvate kinase
MNIARLNLSHGFHGDHAQYVQTIRKLSQRLGIEVCILMDLPGPKYRTGKLKRGETFLKRGATVTLTTRQIDGDSAMLSVNLPNLPQDVRVGDIVLINDGAMKLKVRAINGDEVICRVVIGGLLTEKRGLVVPGMHTSVPFITDSLQEHIRFAIKQQPDYLALSFVSTAKDITAVKAILAENEADIPLITKIERGIALRHFEEILTVSDGIMVARGDLGVDISLEQLPLVQKEIIKECNRAGKPVITATEMLESMVRVSRPTRAEVTDVANAIFDGTDAIMLSAETSIGKYPVQALKMMARIACEVEKELPYDQILEERKAWLEQQTDELISYNACHTGHSLGVKVIVAFTQSGSTAGRISKYRPKVPVLAITPNPVITARLFLRWGVYPVLITGSSSMSELFEVGARVAKESGLAMQGDLIVITGGIPLGIAGSTNLLKVEKI